jgi:hypothetical protein
LAKAQRETALSKEDCQARPPKAKCCPNGHARKISREESEDVRQVARDVTTVKPAEPLRLSSLLGGHWGKSRRFPVSNDLPTLAMRGELKPG